MVNKNHIHEVVLTKLIELAHKYSNFRFGIRDQSLDKLNEGFWFNGSEEYATVRLFNIPSAKGRKDVSSTCVLDIGLANDKISWVFKFRLIKPQDYFELKKKIADIVLDKTQSSFRVLVKDDADSRNWYPILFKGDEISCLNYLEEFISNVYPELHGIVSETNPEFIIKEKVFEETIEKVGRNFKKQNMRSWVVSPNAEGSGVHENDWLTLIEKERVAPMGWGAQDKLGRLFFEEVSIGDLIIVAKGANKNKHTFLAGIVDSNVFEKYYEGSPDKRFFRKLTHDLTKEELKLLKLDFTGAAYGNANQIPAIYELKPNSNLVDKLIVDKVLTAINKKFSKDFSQQIKEREMLENDNLNRILYGPPGTGKTYHTIDLAVKIASPDEFSNDHKKNKIIYERLIKQGKVVFTTFHQSMSYEEFVEGIKPDLKGENVVYQIENGIFKSICEEAKSNKSSSEQNKLPFEEAFQMLVDDWETNPDLKFPLRSEGYDFTIIEINKTSIRFKKASGGTGHTLSIATLKRLYYGEVIDFKQGVGIYYPSVINKIESYNEEHVKSQNLSNFVLIIDEINRGNIASIFGELITLIEDSKRVGKDEELNVTLPYSKELFSVPSNLYIIGTMNTADRSVEALDTALRRRFVFNEMMPDYELTELDKSINGIHLVKLLKTINERIEVLKDRDHLIGHSYFMKVQDEQGLADAFNHKVVPLLKEYFYGDFGQIGLVLGKGFIRQQENGKIQFANFGHEALEDFRTTPIYVFEPINESNIISACRVLLGETGKASE